MHWYNSALVHLGLVHWCIGALVNRSIDGGVHCYIPLDLVHWCIGALVHWCIGAIVH